MTTFAGIKREAAALADCLNEGLPVEAPLVCAEEDEIVLVGPAGRQRLRLFAKAASWSPKLGGSRGYVIKAGDAKLNSAQIKSIKLAFEYVRRQAAARLVEESARDAKRQTTSDVLRERGFVTHIGSSRETNSQRRVPTLIKNASLSTCIFAHVDSGMTSFWLTGRDGEKLEVRCTSTRTDVIRVIARLANYQLGIPEDE